MAKADKLANEFLASELIAANLAEFHLSVGGVLRRYYQNEIIASDAVAKIADLHARLRKCNLNLEVQRKLLPP